jgi:methylmalonyl-CoA mutase
MNKKIGLSDVFSSNTREDWKKAAIAETNEADPLQTLQWKTSDGLAFSPIYDADDVKSITWLQNFHLTNSRKEFSSPRHWLNMPHIHVADANKANKLALDHLKNEADGVLFTLPKAYVDFQALLKDISWPHCSVSFFVPSDFSVKYLKQFVTEKGYQNNNLEGALFWEKLPTELIALSDINHFKEYGLYIKSSTPILEIATALAQAVQFIDVMEKENVNIQSIIKNISFSLPVGNHFLEEICKLKSLRMLWYQVVQALGISTFLSDDLHIHTRSEIWINEKYQPHGNLLRSTISSMAAVAGGTNAHTVCPEKETDKTMNRVARNTSFILRDESYFGKEADPFAGSYVIEKMTDELSKVAWQKFQSMI